MSLGAFVISNFKDASFDNGCKMNGFSMLCANLVIHFLVVAKNLILFQWSIIASSSPMNFSLSSSSGSSALSKMSKTSLSLSMLRIKLLY